ncbi:MAG: UTRA domain-containing protein [Acidiferrobacterales bacterium]|nr:UTRA domain-containing protein [Acidiferrobacterales bacterium]
MNPTTHAQLSKIQKASELPLYQQIKSDIRNKIDRDEWLPGQKLPSENTLVARLGVSRMTVHRALRELTHEGLLSRVHGLGTFVAKPQRHASLIRLQDIAEEVRATEGHYSCKVLKQQMVKIKGVAATEMATPPDSPVCHLRVVHFQDEVAIQLEDRLIHPDFFTEFENTDFSQRTATDILVNQFKPDEMEHIVRAIPASKSTSRILAIEPGEPCIELTRRTWKNDRIVTRVVLTYPGSRYDLRERYRTEDVST